MAGPLAALGTGGGTLRNSDIAAPTAKQLTVYTISAGARLPQCPTCGPATGWELLTSTLEDLLKRRVEHREAVLHTLGITRSEPLDPQETALDRLTVITEQTEDGAPCDSCGLRLARSAGHLLATPQVLTSEAYWCHLIRITAPNLDGLSRRAQEDVFAQLLRGREHDRTPWLICDGCTELFLADWPSAREHVLRGTHPRGPGRLRNRFGLADYVLPAARAWIRERGWWPVTVVAPIAATDDACDLCAKPVWAKETVSFLKPDVVAEWNRAGVLETRAAPPRRSRGRRGWLACEPCLAGVFARLYRSKRG